MAVSGSWVSMGWQQQMYNTHVLTLNNNSVGGERGCWEAARVGKRFNLSLVANIIQKQVITLTAIRKL